MGMFDLDCLFFLQTILGRGEVIFSLKQTKHVVVQNIHTVLCDPSGFNKCVFMQLNGLIISSLQPPRSPSHALNNGNLEHSDETSPAFYIPQNRCKFQQEFVCDSCLGFLFLSFIIPISIIIIIAIIIAIIIMNENAYLLNPFELLIVVPFNN